MALCSSVLIYLFMLQLIIDESFGQFISIDVTDEDRFNRDDSLGKYVICVCCIQVCNIISNAILKASHQLYDDVSEILRNNFSNSQTCYHITGGWLSEWH